MNILLLTSHSIAEYDDLRMFNDLGYDVFSIGAYTDPGNPGDDLRPSLTAPYHPDLDGACHDKRVEHAGEPEARNSWAIDWAKADLPEAVIEWADTVIIHHYLDRWLLPQWPRLRDRVRVIWRTCGQSDPGTELTMRMLREQGLQIVRYSPKEGLAFGELGTWAGEDALIRFGKYPDDYLTWHPADGIEQYVANVTQDMLGRGNFTGLGYWLEQSSQLLEGAIPKPAGPGSERLPGGVGKLSYGAMLAYLKNAAAYIYTGTSPASYTLGLMEAMFTGVPIHAMPRERFWATSLYEAPEIVGSAYAVNQLLEDRALAESESARLRQRASELFGIAGVSVAWDRFLGGAGR